VTCTMKYLWLLAVIGCGAPTLYAAYLKRRLDVLLRILNDERSRQRSLSASYGRITEQWFPLMERYPYDSANFRFLGTPIDGVQFEEDRIVFVEFKSRKAELSAVQRRLKQLVQAGKVYWEEFHFFEDER
jgi:predicted Holliday junction resolvase-like endonuclease